MITMNQVVAHLGPATWAIPFHAPSKHQGAVAPYFLIPKPLIFFRVNVSSQALVNPSRFKLRPNNLSGVMSLHGTFATW
jgi:hypothetical protein